MARNYRSEAITKFPIPAGPIEDDFDDEQEYHKAVAAYNHVRVPIITQHEEWVAQEQEEDEQRAEEAAKVRRQAAAKKREEAAAAVRCDAPRGQSATGSSKYIQG